MSEDAKVEPETELRKMEKECFIRLRAIVNDPTSTTPEAVSAIQMIAQLQFAQGWVP